MRFPNSTRFVCIFLFTIFLGFLLSACDDAAPPPPPPKPALTGAGQTFVTSGNADDGDPANGGPTPYNNPQRTASDGPTNATSDPQDFKNLRGNVNVQTGPNPTTLAKANANNAVTSTFVVRNAVNCQFRLSSTASATLNSGHGGYFVEAKILNAAGNPVAGASFNIRYDFKEKPNQPGQLDVSQNGQQFTVIGNGGIISPTDTGPGQPFALPAGNYTLEFKLNIDGTADTSAVIRASASVDLV